MPLGKKRQLNIIFRTISFGAKETVQKKTCARILSQNTPCTFFYKPSVCIGFRLSGFPHVRHAINKIHHAELVSASHKPRKAVVVC